MSKLELVLFDLDDTLYPEMQYVMSGFRHVSRKLFPTEDMQNEVYCKMIELFSKDRGHVFDNLAEELIRKGFDDLPGGLGPDTLARYMIDEYRNHVPRITLYKDAQHVLDKLRSKGLKLGLVTDGTAEIQRKKVEALNLQRLFHCTIYTDELGPGRKYWKPSCYPFQLALDKMALSAQEACYVGDNPSKDFEGPSRLGMSTVWVRRESGVYSDACMHTEPTFQISSLVELEELPLFSSDIK